MGLSPLLVCYEGKYALPGVYPAFSAPIWLRKASSGDFGYTKGVQLLEEILLEKVQGGQENKIVIDANIDICDKDGELVFMAREDVLLPKGKSLKATKSSTTTYDVALVDRKKSSLKQSSQWKWMIP